MYKNILIATDGSKLADKAVAHGIALAKAHHATASVVTVTDIWSAFDMAHEYKLGKKDAIGEYEVLAAAGAKRVLDKAAEAAKAQGVDCRLIHVPGQASGGWHSRRRGGYRRRSHRHGVAWPPGHATAAAGKSGQRGRHAQQGAGDRRPVNRGPVTLPPAA